MSTTRRGWLRALGARPLRPPGARPEPEFAALCIRCSRCFEACPYDSLKPAGWSLGLEAGTPEVRPRTVPCYLCMQCPPACPTGALEPITSPEEVRMGVAEVDPDLCFAHQGILCRTCVDECPLEDVAIYQDSSLLPIVTESCVGCGVCQHFCPTEDAAIRVRPADREAVT